MEGANSALMTPPTVRASLRLREGFHHVFRRTQARLSAFAASVRRIGLNVSERFTPAKSADATLVAPDVNAIANPGL